jgi:hypothetical protein
VLEETQALMGAFGGGVWCFWPFIDIIGCGSAIQASLIAFALHVDSDRSRPNPKLE